MSQVELILMREYTRMQQDLWKMLPYCDPQQMTFDDHLIWEKHNRDRLDELRKQEVRTRNKIKGPPEE